MTFNILQKIILKIILAMLLIKIYDVIFLIRK